MTNEPFTLDECGTLLGALFASRRELRRKLDRLAKSAGGRNYRANERATDRTLKLIDEHRALIARRRVHHRRAAQGRAGWAGAREDGRAMRVQISYLAPVEVVVDTEEGHVERVVALDERVALDRDECAKDGRSIRTDGYGEIADQNFRDTAAAIAEEREWPAWEFGW